MKKILSDIPAEFAHNIFTLPNGNEIYCDRPDKLHRSNALNGFYDSFLPYIDKPMWVIDIGTSCGDSTVVMGSLLSSFEDSKVIAIEPSKEIQSLLLHNLSFNPSVTYDIHNIAAGDANSMIDFIYGSDNGGLLIPELIPERGPCKASYQVQVVNIYQYLRAAYNIKELDKIQFIKIDTEGYDFVVLRGLAPLIYRNRMTIMVEWWNDPSNSNRMFDEIEKLYYRAFNSNGELVNRFDFNTSKRTQDLILKPI